MGNNWQQFLFSFIAQLVLPLTPMIAEWLLTGKVDDRTLAISAAMYSISIGVATNNLALTGASLVVAVIFSALFGFLAAGKVTHISVTWSSIVVIVSFMSIHGTERYKRHISQGELFFISGARNG
jgi:hypothetical protein